MTAAAAILLTALLAQHPAPASLASQAWAALQERRAADAERLFAALTAAAPRDAQSWAGFAAAALLASRDYDARPRLERALELNPAYADAALMLSDLFYRQSRPDDAIRVLERAQQAGATQEAIAARLARLARERSLHAGFNELVTPGFTVLFEGAGGRDETLATTVTDTLTAAWTQLAATLFTAPRGQITITLYTDEQFSDITRAPAWAAAAFDGRIRVPVRGALQDRAELERVLTHELAHAFIRAAAPRGAPGWLEEGIATALEPRDLEWARAEVRRAGRILPPDALTRGFRNLAAADARLAYAQSALIVRTLIERQGPGALNVLLADLARGTAFEQAFQSRYYERWHDFLARFAADMGVAYDSRREAVPVMLLHTRLPVAAAVADGTRAASADRAAAVSLSRVRRAHME